MASSTFNSERNALAIAIVIFVVTVAAVEWGYRSVGGVARIVPGWSRGQFREQLRDLSGDPSILFLGDSRVAWGIADKKITKLLDSKAQAHNISYQTIAFGPLLDAALDAHSGPPGIIMAHYSATSLYFSPRKPPPKMTTQQVLDESIRLAIGQRICSYEIPLQEIGRTIVLGRRPANNYGPQQVIDGALNFDLPYVPAIDKPWTEVQLQNYQIIFQVVEPAQVEARRQATLKAFQRAKTEGWKIVLFRLPLGSELLDLENRLPPQLQPQALSQLLGVEFWDYDADPETRDLATVDGSHLNSQSTQRMAELLARDLRVKLLNKMDRLIETGGNDN